MKPNEIRSSYIDFFRKRGHQEIKPSPLVLENDLTTLFTSSGMQQLVPYLKGKEHPKGKRLVDSQPSLRLQDIEEVGDNRHQTFFEMLGNWSLGDYFKEEQLSWCWEFFTKRLNLPKERLYVSVFEGADTVPKDEESARIWNKLGVSEDKIYYYGVDKNWWSRSGPPQKMPVGGIGGPDSEVFYDFQIPHDPKFGKDCHPNCECGRFLEIGNSVFIQYEKNESDELIELSQKNVDFGGGYERLVAAVNDNPDVFETELFEKNINSIEKAAGKRYEDENKKAIRIISDHVRASVFLVDSGVRPSNKEHGYILRRLIRRMTIKMRELKDTASKEDFEEPIESIFESYRGVYLEKSTSDEVLNVVGEEVEKFKETLERGMKEIEKVDVIDAKKAFDLYQSYGFPLEITEEIFAEKGQKIDKEKFASEFEKHKELSRSASSGMFKGGLADEDKNTVKLHTATHLLHASLRQLLGDKVKQKGSNITSDRLRFDFSHNSKLSEEEIKKVEELINLKVDENLSVQQKELSYDEAIKEGALGFFGQKYPETVKVYTIGEGDEQWFSKELCGGPHVDSTGDIGHVKITKQDKIGADLVRIYAQLENG